MSSERNQGVLAFQGMKKECMQEGWEELTEEQEPKVTWGLHTALPHDTGGARRGEEARMGCGGEEEEEEKAERGRRGGERKTGRGPSEKVRKRRQLADPEQKER